MTWTWPYANRILCAVVGHRVDHGTWRWSGMRIDSCPRCLQVVRIKNARGDVWRPWA